MTVSAIHQQPACVDNLIKSQLTGPPILPIYQYFWLSSLTFWHVTYHNENIIISMNIPSLVNSLVRIPIYQFSVLFDKIAIVWLIRGSIGQFILWAILSIFHLCIILLASLFCLTRRGANWPAVYFALFFSQRQTTFWRLILRIELSLTMKQIVFLDFSPNVIQSAIKSLKSLRSQALPFVIFFFSADAVYWYVTVWLCQYSIAS